ncbi:DUF932 domain-containing protein [Klebsiella pneumoniae]
MKTQPATGETYPKSDLFNKAPRRYEDKKDDIWTTYQRVQENLIKGGLPGRTEKGKRTTTRPVKAIDGDVKLNKALWLIAEKFRTLKG